MTLHEALTRRLIHAASVNAEMVWVCASCKQPLIVIYPDFDGETTITFTCECYKEQK
jgi:hypothetical protein